MFFFCDVVILFSGIMYAFATLGPAMGYIIGGRFLDIYVDFDQIPSNEYVSPSLSLSLIAYNLSCLMTKPTKWHVRPAKTQISLGIHPVWSVFAVRMKKAWVIS